MSEKNQGVILVGHGGLPKDFPREMVSKLMRLEGQRRQSGSGPTKEEMEIDRSLRTWPRTADTDPYQAGLGRLAAHLSPLLDGMAFKVAYNEFCAPNLTEAIDAMIEEGVNSIVVISTMFTPGGSHSEIEIPEEIAAACEKHPEVSIRYAWPFDLGKVAELLMEQIKSFEVEVKSC